MRNLGNRIVTIILIVVLVILIWGGYAIYKDIRQATGELTSPINALGTQSAEMMNPTTEIIPDPVTVIKDVRSLARLETIQYTLEKVITAQVDYGNFGFLFNDKLLFVAHGNVIAGMDLSKMEESDLALRDGVLYVHLPPAEIFVATLDNDKSYVYDRDTGILNQGNVDLETAARQAAEDEILQAALEDGILEQAQVNAENYLVGLFRSMGYDDVVFVQQEAPTPTP